MRLALIMMTMLAAPALAAESSELSGASLIEDCLAYVEDPSSERGRLCSVFISGFIAGIRAGEAAESAARGAETFGDRALRTRLGARLVEGQSALCLQEPVSRAALIEELLAYADDHPPERDIAAADFTRAALAPNHACDMKENRRLP